MDMSKGFPSRSTDMPNDQAIWLFETGSILVVLDMPVGSEFGIDCNSWETGHKFKGIKMIPPGFHYIHYSVKCKDRQFVPRTGMMRFFKPKEFIVTSWNNCTEELSNVPDPSDVIEKLKSNKEELDRYLGIYPFESLKKWVSLTNYINAECVDRVNPLCGIVYSATLFESEPSNSQSRMQAQKENATSKNPSSSRTMELPDMKAVPGTELRFLQIAERSFSSISTPSDKTTLAMDHSHRLEELFEAVKHLVKHDLVLAELQISFICFLVGQVFEAFEQWKKLVGLLCNCVAAVEQHHELYSQFIGILHYHIREIPEDFFVDIVTRSNFLSSCLTNLFENIQVCDCPDSLKKKAEKFKSNLEKRFAWNFDCESGEYAPVLVESS